MKIIYLAAGKAIIEKYNKNIIYNDFIKKRDLKCCMLQVDLKKFDILLATPPCNYYSRANRVKETSKYSQLTKHLLPDIIKKFDETGKPYIVENVINKVRMKELILNLPKNCFYYEYGRHSYFTNIMINFKGIIQKQDFSFGGDFINKEKGADRQGGANVNRVLEHFIDYVIQLEKHKSQALGDL